MSKYKKSCYKFLLVAVILLQLSYTFLFQSPNKVLAINPSFTLASVTLSNSRLSYVAQIGTASSSNALNFIISGTPGTPSTDVDTANLFPQDKVCFDNPQNNGKGCTQQNAYTVQSTATSLQFGVASGGPATGVMTVGTDVVSTQSAQMIVAFTPQTSVASGGKLLLSVPDTGNSTVNNPSDGMPDFGGFDSNTIPTGGGDLTAGTCAANACLSASGFTYSAATMTTTAGTGHVITITLSSALTAGTGYSFTVGNAGPFDTRRFVNPAPATTGHTRGVADTYSITLQSKDASNNLQDSTIMKVAPVDGVLVSATVEETITYTITGVAGGSSACGITSGSNGQGLTTTATTIPFGSITASNTFYDQAQIHSIITNAANGYTLTASESATLSLNGAGVPPLIQDTICNAGGCSAGGSGAGCTPAAWSTTSVNGFGYTLANDLNGHPQFTNASGYCPFARVPNIIATLSSPSVVSPGDQIYLCPRVNVGAAQQTGTYLNNLIFVATPKF